MRQLRRAACLSKPTKTDSAVGFTEYTEIDACGSYVGQLMCHQPFAAAGGYGTRGRLPQLEHVRGRERLRRPTCVAVASAKVRERIHISEGH